VQGVYKTKAYVFYRDSKEISDIVEGSKDFMLDAIYSLLKNIDDSCVTFDQNDLYETTDTNYHIEE
jgi:hypothetical protein